MFEIPLNQVANTNLVGKNEVSIEFAQPEDPETSKSKSNDMDELVEVRFYIPTTAKSKEKKENEDNSDKGSDEEQSEEDEQTQNAAEVVNNQIIYTTKFLIMFLLAILSIYQISCRSHNFRGNNLYVPRYFTPITSWSLRYRYVLYFLKT
jgi:hypothetical protein